jgi:hypothetical protein
VLNSGAPRSVIINDEFGIRIIAKNDWAGDDALLVHPGLDIGFLD